MTLLDTPFALLGIILICAVSISIFKFKLFNKKFNPKNPAAFLPQNHPAITCPDEWNLFVVQPKRGDFLSDSKQFQLLNAEGLEIGQLIQKLHSHDDFLALTALSLFCSDDLNIECRIKDAWSKYFIISINGSEVGELKFRQESAIDSHFKFRLEQELFEASPLTFSALSEGYIISDGTEPIAETRKTGILPKAPVVVVTRKRLPLATQRFCAMLAEVF